LAPAAPPPAALALARLFLLDLLINAVPDPVLVFCSDWASHFTWPKTTRRAARPHARSKMLLLLMKLVGHENSVRLLRTAAGEAQQRPPCGQSQVLRRPSSSAAAAMIHNNHPAV
jgi:hypothetical protein